MEVLEQTRPDIVAADGHVTEALAQLVREHEPGVDDLTLLGIANRIAVGVLPYGILDRSEHLDQCSHLAVVELRLLADTDHTVLPQQLAQPSCDRGIARMSGRLEIEHLDRRKVSFDCERRDAQRFHGLHLGKRPVLGPVRKRL